MIKQLLILLLTFTTITAFAHPHVWVDSVLKLQNGRIQAEWTFDEMFSNVILSDFDIDRDKKLVGMEVKNVKEGMFDNLKNFSYFMRVYCGNTLLDIEGAEDFSVEVKNSRVIYRFYVKLNNGNCKKEMELYNYDDTLYTAINLISVNGSSELKEAADGIRYAVIK